MKHLSNVLLLALSLCSVEVTAQVKLTFKEKLRDSLALEKRLEKLNEVDRGARESYEEGQVTYAPDKKFKIFWFKGTECGANCSNIYASEIHLIRPGKKDKIDSANFWPVSNIYKLNDGKYLVLQEGNTGGGLINYDYKYATLISVRDSKVIYHRINYKDPENGPNSQPDGSLTLYQLFGIDDFNTPVLKFNPITNILSYKRIIVFNLREAHPYAYTYRGYFRYRNGKFVLEKETRTKFKMND